MSNLKYVSAPYGNAVDKNERMKIITHHSSSCLKRDEYIICPLTMGHEFIKHNELPYSSEWWLNWCIALLSKCTEMDVLCIEGWKESVGVTAEIDFAEKNKIKINYITIKN